MSGGSWLITGAAGFIGSNLAAYLLDTGARVRGIDNFRTGKKTNIERLRAHAAAASFDFIEGDIRDRAAIAAAAEGAGTVVHLAAQVAVQQSIEYPEETRDINVAGFINTVEAAAKAGAEKVIYASSCAVYGDNPDLPLDERSATAPLSPYAESKLEDENQAAILQDRIPALMLTGLRFFNIFGPWQDPAGGYAAVIPRWINLLMNGTQPVAFGDGGATRDFCYVGNVCALIAALGTGAARPRRPIYCIGTGGADTLNALYATICDRLRAHGKEPRWPEPAYQPWRTGDILHSRGNISAAASELGFDPAIGLAGGIDEILSQEYGLKEFRKAGDS